MSSCVEASLPLTDNSSAGVGAPALVPLNGKYLDGLEVNRSLGNRRHQDTCVVHLRARHREFSSLQLFVHDASDEDMRGECHKQVVSARGCRC